MTSVSGQEGRDSTDDRAEAGYRAAPALLATGAAYGIVLWAEACALGLTYITNTHAAALLPLFVVAGALVWWAGWRRVVWWVVGLVSLVVLVVALTPIMRAPVHALVRRDPLPAHVDAVIVPHGGSTADGLIASATLDRLLGGIELLHRGVATTIIVVEPHSPFRSIRDQMRVLELAPAGTRIFVAEDVYTTRDEAVKTAAIARAHGIRTVAVVTSPIHTTRACATFAKVGFLVSCVPAPDRTVAVRTMALPADRLRGFGQWLYERLGLVKYRHKGWI